MSANESAIQSQIQKHKEEIQQTKDQASQAGATDRQEFTKKLNEKQQQLQALQNEKLNLIKSGITKTTALERQLERKEQLFQELKQKLQLSSKNSNFTSTTRKN